MQLDGVKSGGHGVAGRPIFQPPAIERSRRDDQGRARRRGHRRRLRLRPRFSHRRVRGPPGLGLAGRPGQEGGREEEAEEEGKSGRGRRACAPGDGRDDGHRRPSPLPRLGPQRGRPLVNAGRNRVRVLGDGGRLVVGEAGVRADGGAGGQGGGRGRARGTGGAGAG